MLNRQTQKLVALFAAGVIVASCSGSSDSSSPESVESTVASVEETTTTTTTIPIVRAPLTGAQAPDETVIGRPAMVVKIDNHPKARPQWGLNQADIVFEENVEQLTRLAAVYQSQGSDPVGPVRSGSLQDIDLLASLNAPLFVWSGGNAKVTSAIRKSTMIDLSHSAANEAGGFRRESSRVATHNLVAETSKLWTLAPADAKPPVPQFEYRADGETVPTDSKPSGAVKISMDGVDVMWEWSPENLTFLRSQDDKPHVYMDDVRVNAPNVIVMSVIYGKSGGSPIAKTIGSGEVWVYTAGALIQGSWERTDALEPYVFKDTKGAVIKLTPGRTWVEVIRAKSAVHIPEGIDTASVPYP